MGNESIKGNEYEAHIQRELSILQWRSQSQHNSNIPRTLFLSHPLESLTQRPSNNTSHFIQGNYIDLNQYYKRQGVSCSANMNPQFVVFQEFISTLANMEKSLTIEENLYTLNTLLSGYEKIYRKLGYAFIHQKCCLITKAGEVRAWINMDPAKSYPDHSVIKQEQMKDLSRNRTSTKALLSTEASICKGIVKMSLCLSDGNREFFNFYEKLRIFMVKNMQIQNLSFRSIRTFLNAYIYENRIIVAKNIYKALQRYHQTEIERKSDKTYTFQVKDSIASDKAHLQQDQYRSYKANSKNSLKKSYLTSEQKQIFLPINTQYSSSNIGKSSNISSKASQRKHMKSYSTNFCTPTHKQDQSTNYLATSTQHMNSRLDLRQENVRKIFEGLQKMTKNQKYFKKVKFDSTGENQNPINKSMFVKQQQSITSKSNVKFHSREQSEVGYFDQTQNIQKIAKDISNIPSYKFNHLKDSNSSQFYSQKNQHENNSQNGSQQPFKRRQSRTFTRFVSGLLQNDQLFVCESEGSFQSIKMKEDVPYSGVLLQMGRSVQAVNDPPPKSKSNHRTVLSGIPNSAFDF